MPVSDMERTPAMSAKTKIQPHPAPHTKDRSVAVVRSLSISAFILVVGIGQMIAARQQYELANGLRGVTPLLAARNIDEAAKITCPQGLASSKPHPKQPADFSGNSGFDLTGGDDETCVGGRNVHIFQRGDSVYVAMYDN